MQLTLSKASAILSLLSPLTIAAVRRQEFPQDTTQDSGPSATLSSGPSLSTGAGFPPGPPVSGELSFPPGPRPTHDPDFPHGSNFPADIIHEHDPKFSHGPSGPSFSGGFDFLAEPTLSAGPGVPSGLSLSAQPSLPSGASFSALQRRDDFQSTVSDPVPQPSVPVSPIPPPVPSVTFSSPIFSSPPASTLIPLTVNPGPSDVPGQCHDICAPGRFYPVASGYDGNRQRQAELNCIVDCNPCAGACAPTQDGAAYQCLSCYALQEDGPQN